MRVTPRPQKSSMAFNLLPAIDQTVFQSPPFVRKHLLFIRVDKGILLSGCLGIELNRRRSEFVDDQHNERRAWPNHEKASDYSRILAGSHQPARYDNVFLPFLLPILFLRDIRPCRSRSSSRDVRTALVIPEKQLRRETLKRENCAFSPLLPSPSTLSFSTPFHGGAYALAERAREYLRAYAASRVRHAR
jgi:hypothetical protein